MNAPELSHRLQLRQATETIHQALHRARPFAAIADGRATRADYAHTLQLLYRYHAAMASLVMRGALALSLPALVEQHRARLAALMADLDFLGLPCPAVAANDGTAQDDFAVGALYTVQGSTLGGKVIFRQLDTLLPDAAGRRFFQGAPDDKHHWQALCTALDARGGDIACMSEGALYAFEQFDALLRDIY